MKVQGSITFHYLFLKSIFYCSVLQTNYIYDIQSSHVPIFFVLNIPTFQVIRKNQVGRNFSLNCKDFKNERDK